MGKKSPQNKMTMLITDVDKLKEKEDFKYLNFTIKWFFMFILTIIIGIIGFVYINPIFGTTLNLYLMTFLVFCSSFCLYLCIRFFFMNKELDVLKRRWLNPYISFLPLILNICLTVTLICFVYFDPENPIVMNLKAAYLFGLMPFTVVHYFLLTSYYTGPVFLEINKICEAKGKKPEESI